MADLTPRQVLNINLSAYGRRAGIPTFDAKAVDALKLKEEDMSSRKTALWLTFLRWSRLNTDAPSEERKHAAWIAATVLYRVWCKGDEIPNLYSAWTEEVSEYPSSTPALYGHCVAFVPIIKKMMEERHREKTQPSLTNMVMKAARGQKF